MDEITKKNKVSGRTEKKQPFIYLTIIVAMIALVAIVVLLVSYTFPADTAYIPSKNFEENPLKRIDWIIALFGTLMTVLVVAFSITSAYSQKQHSQELSRVFKERLDIYQSKIKTDEIVRNEIIKLFESEYDKKIYDYSRTFAREALKQMPKLKEYSFSINQKAIQDVTGLFEECCEKKTILRIRTLLNESNHHKLAMERLFNSPKDKVGKKLIIDGLEDVIAVPFIEIEEYLKEMEIIYKDDPDIYPKVILALEAINKLKLSKANME